MNSKIQPVASIPMPKLLLAGLLAIMPLYAFSERPNILWIDIDDQSPWYNVYGDRTVSTPNLDALANEGIVFERVYVHEQQQQQQ